MKPKVSVIIPVHNVEQYLGDCINSILKNSYKNIEVIAVDDGSTDKSGEILNDYAEKDSRIRVIQKLNGGVSSARNAGLDEATGSYIMFIDSDDWIEEAAFGRLVKLVSETDAEIIFFNMIYHNTQMQTMNYDKKIFQDNLLITDKIGKRQHIYSEFLKGTRLNQVCRCFFKAELITQNKLRFDEDLSHGEDLVFLLEASFLAQSILSINDYLYHYRFNDLSSTNVFKISRLQSSVKINDIFQRYLRLWGLDDIPHRKMLSNRISNAAIENLKYIFLRKSSLTFKQKITFASCIIKDTNVRNALKGISLKDRSSILKDKSLYHKLILFMLKTKILVPMLYLLLIMYGAYKNFRRESTCR